MPPVSVPGHYLMSLLICLLSGPDPQLGCLYEPRFLPDYHPSLFGFKNAMLAQQDLRDTDDKLIAPWDAQSVLCPGTLVDVEATLIVYNFRGEKPATVCLPLTLFDNRTKQHTGFPNSSMPYPDPRTLPVAD